VRETNKIQKIVCESNGLAGMMRMLKGNAQTGEWKPKLLILPTTFPTPPMLKLILFTAMIGFGGG
jgi:hypothetical protein